MKIDRKNLNLIEKQIKQWLQGEKLIVRKISSSPDIIFHYKVNLEKLSLNLKLFKNNLNIIGLSHNHVIESEYLEKYKNITKDRDKFRIFLTDLIGGTSFFPRIACRGIPNFIGLENILIQNYVYVDGITRDKLIDAFDTIMRVKNYFTWKFIGQFATSEDIKKISPKEIDEHLPGYV